MAPTNNDPREEFFNEAQEIVDLLARDLLHLDEAVRKNAVEPDTVNNLFRGAHTLKGLAGLFSLDRLSELTHELENKLDEIRMGRIELTAALLDQLFRAVELIGRLLNASRSGGQDDDPELTKFLSELRAHGGSENNAPASLGDYDIDPGLVSVLTEYEEHRLRTNIQNGTPLYRIRARFPLLTIDKGLEDLKSRAKPLGEIITYLPSGSSGDDDSLELDILFASSAPIEQLRQRIDATGVTITAVPQRTTTPKSPRTGSGSSRGSLDSDKLPSPPKIPNVGQPDTNRKTDSHRAATPTSNPSAQQTPLPSAGSLLAGAPTPLPAAKPQVSSRRSQPVIAPAPVAHDAAHPTPVPPKPVTSAPSAHIESDLDRTDKQGIPQRLDDVELETKGKAGNRGGHSVRVDIRRLDHLMNVLGELAIVRGSLSRLTDRLRRTAGMRELTTELHRLHRGFERNLREMQRGILEVRMVPLGQVFERLARVVRQVSRSSGKDIRFVITGSETEVDKLIVEEISDPLLHIVRNSIDHGIESPELRQRVGKPVQGTIALNAYQAGNHVVIEIEDDGAGIDEAKVLEIAVKKRVIREDEAATLNRREILNLLFLPGFSTRESVTDLSGRGVGLDVVKTNISRLGGVVDVSSQVGIITKFAITLPITLAILRALLVDVVGRYYALPLSAVAEATVLEASKIRTVEGREIMSLRGETLPLCRLDRLFGHSRQGPDPTKQFVVVVAMGGRRVGFVVDELYGQQDIVIKALGKSLAGVRGFAGATDLGDQRVGLVLDAAALLEEILIGSAGRRGSFELEGGWGS